MNDTDQVAARARVQEAVDAGSQLGDDGLVGIMFNPRNDDYDPTSDLDLLGVAHEVLVVLGKGGDRFEARFRPPVGTPSGEPGTSVPALIEVEPT